jgi:hypothetical protein
LLPNPYGILATNDGEKLKARYAAMWDRLSEDSLELSHFYAQQQLVGGGYLHQRFWKEKPYNPEVLTIPGSVFVFTVKNQEKAKKLINDWLVNGLPQDDEADWEHNPYRAANGYGEILVNPLWLKDLEPPEWKEL